MVCISCFIAPIVLFIWYKFIYPILQPLIDRWIGNYQLPQPFANLSCPLPEKRKSDNKLECPQQMTSDSISGDDDIQSTKKNS